VAAIAAVAIVAGGVGFLAGRASAPAGGTPAAPAPTGSASAAAPPAIVAPSASAPPGGDAAVADAASEVTRARGGDLAALKAIEARPRSRRTIEEALALEAGHAALAVREAEQLVRDLAGDPALFGDATTMAHARRMALDPVVAPALLAGLSRIPHAAVSDLLFDLAWRGEPGGRLVLLADDLLEGPARKHASPALDVTLLVRAARSCERFASLLPRITEAADDRVLAVLERVDVRTGCGPKRSDDCHACLREGEAAAALEAARDAARGRPFAAPWSLRKR
jgi:hypothetical protein